MTLPVGVYPRIFDSLSEHIAVLDEHGTIKRVNAAWVKFGIENGYTMPDGGTGVNYLHVCDTAAEAGDSDAELIAIGLRQLLDGSVDEFSSENPYQFCPEDPSPCHGPLENRWFIMKCWRLLGDGASYFVVFHQNVTKSVELEDKLRSQTLTLKESNSALQQEINQRKRTESQLITLQNELAHIGRVNTVGQMATGLAHELNQPLLVITQSTDTAIFAAKEHGGDCPELIECFEDIQVATQHAGEIIRALRRFISKDTVNRSPVNLNELITQATQLVKVDARNHSIEINAIASNLPDPVVDRVQIAQVLVNLLRNSVDAMVSGQSLDRQLTVVALHNENQITVTVEDTGPGLDPAVKPFNAFETNKSNSMGMGLSISHSIIEAHGGRLWMDTGVVTTGARFCFTLPLCGENK